MRQRIPWLDYRLPTGMHDGHALVCHDRQARGLRAGDSRENTRVGPRPDAPTGKDRRDRNNTNSRNLTCFLPPNLAEHVLGYV